MTTVSTCRVGGGDNCNGRLDGIWERGDVSIEDLWHARLVGDKKKPEAKEIRGPVESTTLLRTGIELYTLTESVEGKFGVQSNLNSAPRTDYE